MWQRIYRWLLTFLLCGTGVYVAIRLVHNGVRDDIHIVVVLAVLWLCLAYLLLPQVHRRLSSLYLPDYFIGRTKTSDGILGDPINIALYGTKSQLRAAMKAAGWHEPDKLALKSSLAIARASVFGRSYPTAPVSSLFLFGRKQDLAFERQYGDNPRRRHHIRLWKTPNNWWLPGGYNADWLGAATFDRRVGLSLFTGQITHKISENIDTERDFVVSSLQSIGAVKQIEVIEHYTSAYRSRNGGGDEIETDGKMPFITLQNENHNIHI